MSKKVDQNTTSTPDTVKKYHITTERLSATCLLLIAVILTSAALAYTRSMMIPLAFSVFLALILAPVVSQMEAKMRLPRLIPVIFVLLGTVLLIYIFSLLLRNTLLEALNSVDIYRDRLLRAIETFVSMMTRFGLELDRAAVLGYVRDLPFMTFVQDMTARAVGIFSNTVLILVFVFFILSGQKRTLESERHKGLFSSIDQQIRRYLLTKLITSSITAILVGGVLAMLGVDLALMFGVLTFVLNFVPTIGSIVATLLPIPIVILQFDSPVLIMASLAIPTTIQFLIGTVIEPKLLGKSLDLHPATILISLMFWGIIWGLVGMFLAVPIMCAVKLILERFDGTKNLAEVMSGRASFLEKG